MKIILITNLNAYNINCFPYNLEFPPRIGEFVTVQKTFLEHFRSKQLPLRLEVVSITHTEDGVVCELWYNKTDQEIAIKSGAKIFLS